MGQTSAAIVKINGRKVGEITEATATVKSNGQLLPTADDIIKSRGRATAEITFSRVRPVNGVPFSVAKAAINQTVGTMTMQYGGEMIEVTGTFDQTAIKTNISQGATDESGTFTGAVRVIP